MCVYDSNANNEEFDSTLARYRTKKVLANITKAFFFCIENERIACFSAFKILIWFASHSGKKQIPFRFSKVSKRILSATLIFLCMLWISLYVAGLMISVIEILLWITVCHFVWLIYIYIYIILTSDILVLALCS